MIEDHALVRECMVLLLAQRLPGLRVMPVGSLAQALVILEARPDFDLILLDLDLADSKGLATLDRVHAVAQGVPIFVLTGHDSPDQGQLLDQRGARGYVCKTADTEQLMQSLLTALGSEPLRFDDGMAETPWDGSRGLCCNNADDFLSERQRDVLRLLAEGKPNKEISRSLRLSEATVKSHLQALFMRLQVNSRTQAVVMASKLGLLPVL